jgi:hypothetical protein
MKTNRTKKEIEDKIREIVDDSDNFTSDNYGSEGADNGFYEVYYSKFATENTLKEFIEWLFENKK